MNDIKKRSFFKKCKDSIFTGTRWLLMAVFIFILTMVCIISILNIPVIRNKITQYGTSYFSEKTGYKISLGEIKLQWFDNAHLQDLVIYGKDHKPMIALKSANINLTLSKLYLNNTLSFDYVDLEKPQVNLRFYNSDSINIKKFAYDLAKVFSTQSVENDAVNLQYQTKKFKLVVPLINIYDGKFTYDDDDEPNMDKSYFDYYHIKFDSINAVVKDFDVSADSLHLTVNHLDTKTPHKELYVKDLTTKYTFTFHQMTFENLLLKTKNSIVGNYLKFNYNDIPELIQFNTHTLIDTHLVNSTVDTSELKYFFDFFDDKNTTFRISGDVNGKVNDFVMKKIALNLSEKSNFLLSGEVKGLPDYQATKLNVDINNFKLNIDDLIEITNNNTIQKFNILNNLSGKGHYISNSKTHTSTFQLNTPLGHIDLVLNYKHDKTDNQIQLDGNLDALDFDLQKLLNIEIPMSDAAFHTIYTYNYNSNNTIFDNPKIDAQIQIDSIQIANKTYNNINLTANYNKERLHVFVDSKDKKMLVKGTTLIKFDSLTNSKLNLDIIDSSLELTGFFNDNESIEGSLTADIYGDNFNNYTGVLHLQQMVLKKKKQRIDIGNTKISYKKNGNRSKILKIQSSLFDFESSGVYNLTQLRESFVQSLEEYKRLFQQDDVSNQEYYNKKINKNEDINITFSLEINDINPFLSFTNIPVRINKDAKFEGNIIVTNTTFFNITGKVDTLNVYTTKLIDSEVDFSTSKFNNNSDVLSTLNLFSKHQIYDNEYIKNTDSTNLFFIWANNKIEFEASVKQPKTNSQYTLQGSALKKDTKIDVNIKNSSIRILGDLWKTNDNHKITIENNFVNFDNVILEKNKNHKNKQQMIVVNGKYSDNPINPLSIDIINMDLQPFGELFNQDISGYFNSRISISNQKFLNNIDIDFSIAESRWNNVTIGTIVGSVSTPNLDGHKIQCTVRKNKNDYAFVYGSYQPFEEVPIDITIVGNKIPLSIAQTSLSDVFSDINGELSGVLNINSTLENYDISGKGEITNGKGTIDYLKTETRFSGNLLVDNSIIGLDSLVLVDNNENTAIINGGFKHQNFNNFELDLSGYFNEFVVMDTNKKDNDLYYGKGVGTGSISIKGPLSNFRIYTNIKTEKGTHIIVPLIGDDIDYHQDFINFVSSTDTENNANALNKIDTIDNDFGFDFEMELEVTPDASLEVILSETSRDYLKGKTKGNLNFKLNKNSDLTLNGEIEALDGEYSFTIQKLFNKQFKILPNSKIKWVGDPYNGLIDVNAQYSQLASLEPLFDEASSEINPDIKRKYNTGVTLNLTGNILQPNLDFNIEFDQYPISLSNEIEEVKSRVLADKQERERQAFSLIALYKFSPYNDFSLSLASQIGGSFSEILSNQFSHWMSQVDENLEIDINLGKLDQNAFNELQLRMSYILFDGRMVVTRDGGVTDGQNITNFNSIAGDWRVEYLIFPHGRLKIKMYKKNNYNSITTLTNTNISTGVSIVYTKNFHELKEIWQKSRKEYLKKSQ